MELAQDKLELIEKIIKGDKKFSSNEDLFDDFLNEACKRSFLIIKSVNDPNSLEAYLRKIVATSIVVVLKDSGRVRRTKEGFVATQEVSLEPVNPIAPANKYANLQVNYDVIDLQDGPEDIVIKKEILQTVMDAVYLAHSSNVSKQYLQLYEMRYVEGMKQKEIAHELNLSQSEVSKRLFELMEHVKKSFNQ